MREGGTRGLILPQHPAMPPLWQGPRDTGVHYWMAPVIFPGQGPFTGSGVSASDG